MKAIATEKPTRIPVYERTNSWYPKPSDEACGERRTGRVIAGLTGQCRNVMSVTKLDRALEFYANPDEAVAALQAN